MKATLTAWWRGLTFGVHPYFGVMSTTPCPCSLMSNSARTVVRRPLSQFVPYGYTYLVRGQVRSPVSSAQNNCYHNASR